MSTPSVAELTPGAIDEMRAWVLDCEWCEDADAISELSDVVIVRGVQRHYVGGIAQFMRDAAI